MIDMVWHCDLCGALQPITQAESDDITLTRKPCELCPSKFDGGVAILKVVTEFTETQLREGNSNQ